MTLPTSGRRSECDSLMISIMRIQGFSRSISISIEARCSFPQYWTGITLLSSTRAPSWGDSSCLNPAALSSEMLPHVIILSKQFRKPKFESELYAVYVSGSKT